MQTLLISQPKLWPLLLFRKVASWSNLFSKVCHYDGFDVEHPFSNMYIQSGVAVDRMHVRKKMAPAGNGYQREASDETAIVLVSGSHKKKLRGGRGRRALE